MDALNAFRERMGCKYLEIRPTEAIFESTQERNHFVPVASYFFHSLDLSPGLDELFQSLDKDSVQRRILRAERAGLVEEIGISDRHLKDFYRLFTLTRKRHHLPPSSLLWFQNLIKCQGSAVQIRVARKENIAVAAILTLRFKDKVYYKYGCSDARFHRHGAMPWLLWHAISDAKLDGARRFDFGRTEADNFGLLTFKNHWAPNPKPLVYWRLPENSPAQDGADGWKMRAAKRIFSYMPMELSILTGKVFYRHFG